MKIVHFSDTHLGYHKYQKLDSRTGLNQREQDVYDAFEFVISTILRIQPDLVLHAGDLFDSFHPSNRTLSFCLEQLGRLTAEVEGSVKLSTNRWLKGIPIVIISGNHSWPKQQIKGSVFSVLSQFPGVHAVYNETYQLLRFHGISIHAIPHCASQEKLEEELSKVTPDPNADYNVAILHASIPHIATNFYIEPSQISVNPDKLLELEMDYIALGHSHCAKVKLRDIGNAIVSVQLIGVNRAAFNALEFRRLSALFEKAFHVEYMPHFYSDVEIPDSIRLVKSLQEDFKIFISEQEISEQEREELLKLGLEYLHT